MAKLRLDKLLADTGRWSRKEARELLRQGRVMANGLVLTRGEEKLEQQGLSLLVDGEELLCQAHSYLMLHKPPGCLSATEDRHAPTVLDLLPRELQRQQLFPVGRLDQDSTGLLLLTNHGELAHRLLSPRYHVEKCYLVHTQGEIDAGDIAAFAQGLCLGNGEQCRPAGLKPHDNGPDWCLVTLTEGKFHQVKRMLACRGKPVLSLHRLSMGPLQLDDTLAPGAYRPLTPQELTLLLGAAGL